MEKPIDAAALDLCKIDTHVYVFVIVPKCVIGRFGINTLERINSFAADFLNLLFLSIVTR